MKSRCRVDLVEAVQALAANADKVEQIAHHVRRIAVAAERIANDVKGFYGVVSPLAEALKSKRACSPARA